MDRCDFSLTNTLTESFFVTTICHINVRNIYAKFEKLGDRRPNYYNFIRADYNLKYKNISVQVVFVSSISQLGVVVTKKSSPPQFERGVFKVFDVC